MTQQSNAIYSNPSDIPLSLAVWLAADEYRGISHLLEISATTLLKSPRAIIGEKRANFPNAFKEDLQPLMVTPELLNALKIPSESFKKDLASRIDARMGTAIHNSVEEAWINTQLRNQALLNLGYSNDVINRIKVNVDPKLLLPNDIPIYVEQIAKRDIIVDDVVFTISGQIDLSIEGTLRDTKTTTTFTYETGYKKDDYILQGSTYKWISPDIITQREYFFIDFLFKNWIPYKAFKGNYPNSRIIGEKMFYMSDIDIELYIHNKLKQVVQYWNTPLHLIPCCPDSKVYSTGTVYKYYANGAAGATKSTRNFDDLQKANAYKAQKGGKGEIVEVRGKPFTCDYCADDHINPEPIKEEVMNLADIVIE